MNGALTSSWRTHTCVICGTGLMNVKCVIFPSKDWLRRWRLFEGVILMWFDQVYKADEHMNFWWQISLDKITVLENILIKLSCVFKILQTELKSEPTVMPNGYCSRLDFILLPQKCTYYWIYHFHGNRQSESPTFSWTNTKKKASQLFQSPRVLADKKSLFHLTHITWGTMEPEICEKCSLNTTGKHFSRKLRRSLFDGWVCFTFGCFRGCWEISTLFTYCLHLLNVNWLHFSSTLVDVL